LVDLSQRNKENQDRFHPRTFRELSQGKDEICAISVQYFRPSFLRLQRSAIKRGKPIGYCDFALLKAMGWGEYQGAHQTHQR
jgi:hypothetical protein